MLWGGKWRSACNHPGHLRQASGPERAPPDATPEICTHWERAGGFETGIIDCPPLALEPHVIDTFDKAADLDTAALVASIERTIGPLPVFTGQGCWNAIAAAKSREYMRELNGSALIPGVVVQFMNESSLGHHRTCSRISQAFVRRPL